MGAADSILHLQMLLDRGISYGFLVIVHLQRRLLRRSRIRQLLVRRVLVEIRKLQMPLHLLGLLQELLEIPLIGEILG